MLNEKKDRNRVDNDVAENLSPKLKAVWNEMFECREEMEDILNQRPLFIAKGFYDQDVYVPIASYLLAKACENNDPFSLSFSDLPTLGVDEDIYAEAVNGHLNEIWSDLLQLLYKHAQNIFCLNALLRNQNDPNATPYGVAELAIELLSVQPGENVAELCCKTGSVISEIKESCPTANTTGYETDQKSLAVAKARNEFASSNTTLIKKEVFELVDENGDSPKYDKIFANYPFGVRLRDLHAGKGYLNRFTTKIPSISKATSSDWLYNMLMTELLTENGKAVGIMTNGSTWNMIDAPTRQYFVENELIECVIALPAKLFNNTPIATSMIVFSHGNDGVRLVDASSLFTAGRRTNELTENDIEAIKECIATDSEKSMFITKEALRENDYVLNISRYTASSESIENGVAFEKIIKRITRGAPLNAKDLDKISSAIPTDMQYLMLANIQNGLIDTNLPYLTEIDPKNEKYCLTNHCLILSKNGYPYKIAVAEIKDGQKIMANGNLYIIELNEERVDPYYLAAYLSSESGTAALKSITVGATIPSIGVDQLKRMIIPLPPIDDQRKIASEYQEARDEITLLQLKIEKARNRMQHLFEEEE